MVLEFTDGTSATEADLSLIFGQPLSTGGSDVANPPMKLNRGTQNRAGLSIDFNDYVAVERVTIWTYGGDQFNLKILVQENIVEGNDWTGHETSCAYGLTIMGFEGFKEVECNSVHTGRYVVIGSDGMAPIYLSKVVVEGQNCRGSPLLYDATQWASNGGSQCAELFGIGDSIQTSLPDVYWPCAAIMADQYPDFDSSYTIEVWSVGSNVKLNNVIIDRISNDAFFYSRDEDVDLWGNSVLVTYKFIPDWNTDERTAWGPSFCLYFWQAGSS